MRVGRSHVHFQPLCQAIPPPVLRQHPIDRFANQPFRLCFKNLARADFPESSGISRVMAVDLLVKLLTGQPNLLRVDDDQSTAVIRARSVVRHILADQHLRSP